MSLGFNLWFLKWSKSLVLIHISGSQNGHFWTFYRTCTKQVLVMFHDVSGASLKPPPRPPPPPPLPSSYKRWWPFLNTCLLLFPTPNPDPLWHLHHYHFFVPHNFMMMYVSDQALKFCYYQLFLFFGRLTSHHKYDKRTQRRGKQKKACKGSKRHWSFCFILYVFNNYGHKPRYQWFLIDCFHYMFDPSTGVTCFCIPSLFCSQSSL